MIQVKILYEGSAKSMLRTFAPLQRCNPISSEAKSIGWPSASEAMGRGFSGLSSQKGISIYRFPVGATSFSYPSMKRTYDHFAADMAAQPAFAYSLVLWEAYATHAVKAVPDAAAAIADRGDDMLVAAMVIYPPELEAEVGEDAERFGRELRGHLVDDGGELHAYVNYAHGDEGTEAIYGHQGWRLERLRRLKSEFDPENRFGFYSPIS